MINRQLSKLIAEQEIPNGEFRVYNDGEIDHISSGCFAEGNDALAVDQKNFPDDQADFGYVVTDLQGAVTIREAILYGVY